MPEEYEGVGADALATCFVIEEVARVCASSSLIPAVNKLSSLPLMLARNEEVKKRYLTPLVAAKTTFSYGLSEREAGSDIASMRTRAVRDGDDWVLNGQKSWITNAGVSEYYTVLAVTDPEGKARQQRQCLRRGEVRRGVHLRGEGAQAQHQGQPDARAPLRPRPDPR